MFDVVADLVVGENSRGGGGRAGIPPSDHGGRQTGIVGGFESEGSSVHRQTENDLFRRTSPAREDAAANVTDSFTPCRFIRSPAISFSILFYRAISIFISFIIFHRTVSFLLLFWRGLKLWGLGEWTDE